MARTNKYDNRILVDGTWFNPDAKHGTTRGYFYHGCRCTKCSRAGKDFRTNKGYSTSERARKFRYGQRVRQGSSWYHPGAPHGKVSGYTYWGCRCGDCYKTHLDNKTTK